MMAKIGWIITLLAVLFAKLGIIALAKMIEAEDPTNPAVMNGYHYPASLFLYAILISPLLVIFSSLAIIKKEPTKYLTLIYGVPALGIIAFYAADQVFNL